MKLLAILLFTVTMSAQMNLHNADIVVGKGTQIEVFGNVGGTGSIVIKHRASFKADTVACEIKVLYNTSPKIQFNQDDLCKILNYKIYNILGQYIGKGVYKNGSFEKFDVRYKHSYLIIVFENGHTKKLLIK